MAVESASTSREVIDVGADSDVRRYRDEIVKLREQISRESRTIADKRKSAADSRASAARTNSSSIAQSRLRDADRHETAAIAAEKKRADLDRKIADKERALAAAQVKWEKEQQSAQKRAFDALHRQTEQAAQQFTASPLSHTPMATRIDQLEYDVFLSHASEDKDEVARPLKDSLEARGLRVWFDEINITVGKSIRREIERGITSARFGLVIVSPHFMVKEWTQTELDALWGKKLGDGDGDGSLLPVWHKVTKDEVQARLPLLAGLLALNTSVMSIEEIAESLAKVIHEKQPS